MADRSYMKKGKYDYSVVPKSEIEESIKIRQQIINEFGFIPESILPFTHRKRDKKLDDYVSDNLGKNSYGLIDGEKNKEQFKQFGDKFDAVYGNASWRGLSQFNPQVAEFVIKLYSKPGDTIFDSCMGRLCRGMVAHLLKRHYIGYDVSKVFLEANLKRWEEEKKLRKFGDDTEQYRMEIINRDSRSVHLPDNSVECCFTSPPYYNIEYYGDEPEQLGKDCDYPTFLLRLKQVIAEQYRILKPCDNNRNYYAIMVVNDFRLNGNMIPFHSDVIQLYLDVGFKMHDISVYKVGDMTKIFAERIIKHQIVAKTMEYIMVFKKIDKNSPINKETDTDKDNDTITDTNKETDTITDNDTITDTDKDNKLDDIWG